MRISDWSSDVCSSDLLEGPSVAPSSSRRHFDFAQWLLRTNGFKFQQMDLCPKENDRLCLLAEPVVFESCFRLGLGKSPLALAGFRPVIAALRNTRRFSSAAAKIVKLRTTHGTLADDGNAVDVRSEERRVGKECVRTGKFRCAPNI